MKHTTLILALALTLGACTGTNTNGNDDAATTDRPDTTTQEWRNGEQAARQMSLDCGTDSTAIQRYMLQFQADVYTIEQKSGVDAARQYRDGFQHYITDHEPEIAAMLF